LKVLKDYLEYKIEDENVSMVAEDALQQLLFEVENVPFPTPENYRFKFVDLFAGIGGFRIAMQNLGGKCVFTSEWDKEAQKTYRANFGEVPFGDITKPHIKSYIPKARHEGKGNGFGYEIINDNGIANAIVVGGMGRERNLVLDHRITDFTPTTHIKGTVNREGIRKMTPREWARLQGFPDKYIIMFLYKNNHCTITFYFS
jgi:site-specific DNA-cytosine methylase